MNELIFNETLRSVMDYVRAIETLRTVGYTVLPPDADDHEEEEICGCGCGCEPDGDWHWSQQPWCRCVANDCECVTDKPRIH